jgi:hypothetical protein
MATKINVVTNKSGISIPAGVVVVASIHFPTGNLIANEEGVFDGNIDNVVTADLTPFANKGVYQESLGENSLGSIDEMPSAFYRTLTEGDYTALAGANALGVVRGWIKDFIEEKVGGTCEIVDLSIID